MMKRRFLTIVAIALLLVLGSNAVYAASVDRARDFTQLNQTKPECPKDPDDDCK
jgi:hypothetical protein